MSLSRQPPSLEEFQERWHKDKKAKMELREKKAQAKQVHAAAAAAKAANAVVEQAAAVADAIMEAEDDKDLPDVNACGSKDQAAEQPTGDAPYGPAQSGKHKARTKPYEVETQG